MARWKEESIGLRPPFLRSAQEVDPDRHPLHSVKRGSYVSSPFGVPAIEDGD